MKKLTSLAMVFVLVLLPAISAQAEKPLYGVMDLQFNHECWVGPSSEIPDWTGTMMIDGTGPYTIVFYNTGSGKPFGLPFKGQAFPDQTVVFFGETWALYDWANFDCGAPGPGDEQFDFGVLHLSGTDEGVSTTVNGKFQANGIVNEASGDFAKWLGRKMHMSGVIVPGSTGLTVTAGIFRLN